MDTVIIERDKLIQSAREQIEGALKDGQNLALDMIIKTYSQLIDLHGDVTIKASDVIDVATEIKI